MAKAQKSSGELPYRLLSSGADDWPHFLCYQYNAFELLDLARYYTLTKDDSVRPIIEGVARFLAGGVSPSGSVRYNCAKARPEVLYYATAVAAALTRATSMGVGDYQETATRAFNSVLKFQRPGGGFEFFSRGNYRVLSDRRSYPRNLAMMLYHLLLKMGGARDQAELSSSAPQGGGSSA